MSRNFKIERIKGNKPKPTRYYSDKQEKTVAQNLGGKQTSNSGATPFDKGDVKIENFLIECKTKTTSSSTISIHKDWLEKIQHEACFQGKENTALAFNFGPDEKLYYIIDENLFKFLIAKLDS